MSKIDIAALDKAVDRFCDEMDRHEAELVDSVHELKAAVKGVKSRQAIRDALVTSVARRLGIATKTGQRGTTFATKSEKGQKRVTRMLAEILGTPEKASVEIDFDNGIVTAMQKVLKSLETYAAYEVDNKKVGEAKALALLIKEAKDRIEV